jgi:hypothetical protein
MCQADGYLSLFCMTSIITYSICLSHCLLKCIEDAKFNETRKGYCLNYHFISLSVGASYCFVCLIASFSSPNMTDVIGPGIMGTCNITQGSKYE